MSKILFCVTCSKEMVVPNNSGRKYCKECNLERQRQRARDQYKNGPNEARTRATQKQLRKYKEDSVYRLFVRSRGRASVEGREFNLELSDIIIPSVCPVLGTPFQYKTYYTASLDRIDSSKGYIKGNVQVMSHKANAMKNSASQQELIKFAEWVLTNYNKEQ